MYRTHLSVVNLQVKAQKDCSLGIQPACGFLNMSAVEVRMQMIAHTCKCQHDLPHILIPCI